MNYPKDHLVIHKQDSLNVEVWTKYLVNTYYGSTVQTQYFLTQQAAESWVEMERRHPCNR